MSHTQDFVVAYILQLIVFRFRLCEVIGIKINKNVYHLRDGMATKTYFFS